MKGLLVANREPPLPDHLQPTLDVESKLVGQDDQHEANAGHRVQDQVAHEALLATAGLRRAEYIGRPAETLVELYLRRRPLGIDLVRFRIATPQAINLIRDPSYDSFQPVEAIEQGGEFEGVDPLHDVPFCIAPLVDL